MVLRAAASKDWEKMLLLLSSIARHEQLTPFNGLVRCILLMLVAATTFVARELFIVGGHARYRATTHMSPGPQETPPSLQNIGNPKQQS